MFFILVYLAGIIATEGMDGLVLATIMAGLILIIMGLLRLGSLIKYIPHTITVGFTAGIAVTLVVGQLKDFFGLTYPAGASAIETMEKLTLVVENISTFNPWAFAIGLLGLAILIVWPKVSKKNPRLVDSGTRRRAGMPYPRDKRKYHRFALYHFFSVAQIQFPRNHRRKNPCLAS